MEQQPSCFVSVIVPVFNDAQRLKICLAELENQTYPKNLYEVIVVDNGSDAAEDIPGVVAQFGQVIATSESLPGSYAARNKGISLAKGSIIAFTDADCIPAADWIEKGVKRLLSTANCGLVAGKIELFFQDPQRVTPVELYESLTAFPQQEFLDKHRYGATANVFTWKKVIEQVGLFDATLKSGGDVEWGKRVHAYGYQQVYADDACVSHPARYSWAQLYKRTVRVAGGVYDFYCQKQASFWQRNKMFMRIFLEDLVSPIIFTFNTFLDKRLKGIEQKIKVSGVMFFVRYLRAWEMMRLKFGGISARE